MKEDLRLSKRFNQGHALVIGVGQDLPNTIDDAKGLADILKDKQRCAYPAKQVKLLTDKNASRQKIIAALQALAQSATPDSSVIVYFSGHGYRVKSSMGMAYYLMPYGYNTEELADTAISGAEFTELLKAIKAKKLLLLLDCCHAGGIEIGKAKSAGLTLTKAPLPPEAQTLLAQGKGRVVIASSKEGELSYAGTPYSAFTLALVEALCGTGAAKKDGYVRVTDLAMYTREVVSKRTQNKQHPILDYQQADNFVVAYYAGGEVEPKGMPFEKTEIDIEPESGKLNATYLDQRGQTVGGTQISVKKVKKVKKNHGFRQPRWTVGGDVTQINIDRLTLETQASHFIAPTTPPPKFTDLFEIVSQPDDIAATIFRKGRTGRHIFPYDVAYSTERAGSENIQESLYQTLRTGLGALLVQSRAGLGKTREVVELALRFYEKGWTVCVATNDQNVNRLASFPDELRGERFLLVFDDLHQRMTSNAITDQPYIDRLDALLNFLDINTAPGEYCVIATARTAPRFQTKLQRNSLHPLWKRFDVIDLPEFTADCLQKMLLRLTATFHVAIDQADAAHLISNSDRTPRTLLENIEQAKHPDRQITKNNWLPSQGELWQTRFAQALSLYPTTTAVFQALQIIRETGLPTRMSYIVQLANRLSDQDATTATNGLVDSGLLGLHNGILDVFADEQLRESLRGNKQKIPGKADYTTKIIEAMTAALSETPVWSSDLITFMVNLHRVSKAQDAEFLLTTAMEYNFEEAIVYALQGIGKYHRGDYKGAGKALSRAISLGQNHLSVRYYRAAAYHELHLYKKAEKDANYIFKHSDSAFAYRIRGDIRKHLGKCASAEKDFLEVIKRGEGDGQIYEGLGFVQFQLGKTAEAEASLTKAIELNNNEPNVYIIRAYARYFSGNYDGVEDDILKAKELGLQNVDQYLALSDMRFSMNQYADIEKELTTAVNNGIANAELYLKLGYAFLFQKKYAEAAINFLQAINLEPQEAQVYSALALARILQKKSAEGEAEMTAAIAGGHDHAFLYYARASMRFEQQKYKGAEEDATMALNRNAKDNNPDPLSDDLIIDLYYYRGLTRHYQDKYAEAEADLSTALQLGKTDADLYFYRGFAKLRQGKYPEAEEDITNAITQGRNDGAIYRMRGGLRGLQNKFQQSEEDLTIAITQGEVDDEIYYMRGITRNKLDRYAEAEEDLTIAINRKTQFSDAWTERGYARFYQENYAGAEADLTEAIRRGADDNKIYLHRGDAQYHLGKYAEAEMDYSVIINRGECDKSIYIKRAKMCHTLGKYAEAEADYTEAISRGQNDALIHRHRGAVRRVQNKFTEAEADFTKAIVRGLNNADIYYQRGMAHDGQEKYAEAEADYTEAIKRRQDDANVYRNRGVARIMQGKFIEAEADFSDAIARQLDNADIYYQRGLARDGQEKYAEAEADYTEAINRGQDDADVYCLRGRTRLWQKKDAEEDFTAAIERNPDDAYLYYSRGKTHSSSGKHPEAEADYLTAMEQSRKAVTEGYWQSDILFSKAEADYTNAIEHHPDDTRLYYLRGVLRLWQSENQSAEEDFTAAIERTPDDAYFYYCRGKARSLAQKYAEAEADFTAAINRGQDDADVYRCRADIRKTGNQPDQAEADYTEAIRRSEDAGDYFSRGALREEQERYTEAEADYTEVIRQNPDSAFYYCYRANTRVFQNKLTDAESDYTIAINKEYYGAWIYRIRAYVYIQLLQLNQAKQDCDSAATLYPDNPDSLACRADLHLAAGEMDEAINQYKKVLDMDDRSYRYFHLAMAFLLAGSYDEALDTYKKAVETGTNSDRQGALFDFNFWTKRHASCLTSPEAIEAKTTIRQLLEMKLP
jgi:tetratricopeptide (TPR) repeat protein